MSLLLALFAAMSVPSETPDPRGATAAFLAAVHGTIVSGSDTWSVKPWLFGTVAVGAGEWGRVIVRESDAKVVSWSKYHGARQGGNGTRSVETYLDESEVRALVSSIFDRWQRTDLAITSLTLTRDSVDSEGGFRRGIAFAQLAYRGDPNFGGPLRRGAKFTFDAATGEPRSFGEADHVVAVRGTDAISHDEALGVADLYVQSELRGNHQSRTSHEYKFITDMREAAAVIQRLGANPFHIGPVNAYWCLVATYNEPPGSWVAVRMSDGKVLWSSIQP